MSIVYMTVYVIYLMRYDDDFFCDSDCRCNIGPDIDK